MSTGSAPPFFSILLSVYNGERFLAEALTSVFCQTFPEFELIAIDDGSTDASAAILAEFTGRDSRLRLVRQPNSGLTKALNTAAGLASGRYLARIDADDVWHADKLRRQYEFLRANPDCALLGTAYAEIDAEQRISPNRRVPLLSDSAEIRDALARFNPFFHSSVAMAHEVFCQAGAYDPAFRYAQDYQLWVKIAARHRCANLPDVLAYRRLTANNLSLLRERQQRFYALKARRQAIATQRQPYWRLLLLLDDALVILLPRRVVSLVRAVKYKIAELRQARMPG